MGFRVRTSKRPRGLSPFKELSLSTLSRALAKPLSHLSPQTGSLTLQSLLSPCPEDDGGSTLLGLGHGDIVMVKPGITGPC